MSLTFQLLHMYMNKRIVHTCILNDIDTQVQVYYKSRKLCGDFNHVDRVDFRALRMRTAAWVRVRTCMCMAATSSFESWSFSVRHRYSKENLHLVKLLRVPTAVLHI